MMVKLLGWGKPVASCAGGSPFPGGHPSVSVGLSPDVLDTALQVDCGLTSRRFVTAWGKRRAQVQAPPRPRRARGLISQGFVPAGE